MKSTSDTCRLTACAASRAVGEDKNVKEAVRKVVARVEIRGARRWARSRKGRTSRKLGRDGSFNTHDNQIRGAYWC